MDIPQEVLAAGPAAVQTYRNALPHGERWATMVALQCPPGTKGSDRAFMQGRYNNQQLDEMPARQAKYIAKAAREAGIAIGGKYYVGGLADGRMWRDPKAWVSSNDDVLRVARERRLLVSGGVNYDPGQAAPQRKLIDEGIVRDAVKRARRANPKLKAAEAREQVIAKHAYRVKGR